MAKEEIGNLVVRVAMDGSQFRHGVSNINRQLKVVKSEFDAAAEKLSQFGKAEDKLRLKSQYLGKAIDQQKEKVKALELSLQEAIEKKGKDARETQNLQVALNNARRDMAKMEHQLQATNDDIDKQTSKWHQLQKSVHESAERMQKAGQNISQTGQNLTIGLTLPLVAVGGTAVKAAIDFESAFTGVQKTVNATTEEFDKMRSKIRDMAKEIPASTTEIAGVAEAAGQLGIKKDAILDFTRTMIDMGNSTNLASDVAATQLARLANIVQQPQDQFDNLGSTIVALGNNLATTEAEISEMGLRIAGAGHQVHLTEPEILGFAAALSSVGINAEAGGSSISRVMVDIASAVQKGGKKLDLFAKVAGESASDFQKAFKKDAADAILDFIEGLGKMQKQGENVFGTLDDLGLSEIRVRDALLRAAGAGDLFRKSLEIGSKAWKENTALTKEAEKRYETTASQLKILWNRIKDVGITLGKAMIPAIMDAIDAAEPFFQLIEKMAKGFSKLSDPLQKIILAFAAMAAALGPILVLLGPLVSGIGSLALAFTAVEGGALVAGGAIAALTGPIGIVAGVLGLLTAGTIGYISAQNDSNSITMESIKALQQKHDQNAKMIDQLAELRSKSLLTNDEFARYLDLQTQINETTDPEKIKDLKEQMEKLRKKSGLSNKQLSRMVDLNKDITEKMPQATSKITEQGNRIADTTGQLRAYNKELAEASVRQLKEKRLEALKKQKELQQQIQDAEKSYRLNLKIEESIRQRLNNWNQLAVDKRKEELQILIKQQEAAGNKGLVGTYQRELDLLNQGKEGLRDQLVKMMRKNDEAKEHLSKLKKQKEELDKINESLKIAYLKQAGINEKTAVENAKHHTTLRFLDQQIEKLNKKKAKMIAETPVQERNNAAFRDAVEAIENQIGKLENARANIKQNTDAAKHYNEQLGKGIRKNVTIDFDLHDWQDAKYAMGQYRAYQTMFPGFAGGTDYAPGGLAWVGEKGPELVNLPRGAQVFPHDVSEKMVEKLKSLPGLATGGEILRKGMALVGEKGRELLRTPVAQTVPLPQQPSEPEVRYIAPEYIVVKIGDREFIQAVEPALTQAQEQKKIRKLRSQGVS